MSYVKTSRFSYSKSFSIADNNLPSKIFQTFLTLQVVGYMYVTVQKFIGANLRIDSARKLCQEVGGKVFIGIFFK